MAVITLKVDEKLKEQSAEVLEELGLDIPTAVRMFLKSVVRENGLPISIKLSCSSVPTNSSDLEKPVSKRPGRGQRTPASKGSAAASELEGETGKKQDTPQEEPHSEVSVVIDYTTKAGRKAVADLFIGAICSVPEGKLTRWSDMERALSARFNSEVTRPGNIRWPSVIKMPDGVDIEVPYWRIVGEHGAIKGDTMVEREEQITRLKSEGHNFTAVGHGIFTGIKVEGYKQKLLR